MLRPKRKIPQYSSSEILQTFCEKTSWEVEFCSDYLTGKSPVSCITIAYPIELHKAKENIVNNLETLKGRIRRNENGVNFLAFNDIVCYLRECGDLPKNETIIVE